MPRLVDSLWRACAYLFIPRVLRWSLLPLLVASGCVGLVASTAWPSLVLATNALLQSWSWTSDAVAQLQAWLGLNVAHWLAPLLLLALLAPVLALGVMLTVALHTTPRLVGLVVDRRFPGLERRHGVPLWRSVLWSLGVTGAALLLALLSFPLWWVPVLGPLVAPLIWGWATAQVMVFDVLADHATEAERRRLVQRHRGSLWAMGLATGAMGLLPSAVWTFSLLGVVLAPVLLFVSIWLYVLVFVISAGWFAHFALSALHEDRAAREGEVLPPRPGPRASVLPAASTPQGLLPS